MELNQRDRRTRVNPAVARKPLDYLPDSLSVNTWLASYSNENGVPNLQPVDLVNLEDILVVQ